MSEGSSGEHSHIRLQPRIHVDEKPSSTTGLNFWESLPPEVQSVIAEPIRNIELSIARNYPEGYTSPLVSRTESIPREQLDRQTDMTSCTYSATANGLRVLDAPRSEYTEAKLKERITRILGTPQTTISASDMALIFASGPPYDQFMLQQFMYGNIRMPRVHPESMKVFRALEQGDVAVASWKMSPSAPKHIDHARTITGFSRGANNSVFLHVIDPVGAKKEKWSFQDWVVASRYERVFTSPVYENLDDMRRVAEGMKDKFGMMSVVAKDIRVIHKKRPVLKLRAA